MTKFSVSKKSILKASLELRQEIRDAFKTAVPPICIEMGRRDDVEAFAMLFETALHTYSGKSISCKNAKSNAPSSYTAEELWMLEKDKYPVELFFKSAEDIEDFAEGYLNAAGTISRQQEKARIEKMAKDKEGAKQLALEVAAKFLANGMSMEGVAEIVGMPVEELKEALAC
ncbi:MAG: hypothetical protein IJT74_02985 [Bacteroidales bacterium]|nr:hypothetical protein [Bacteroidales bacterium]